MSKYFPTIGMFQSENVGTVTHGLEVVGTLPKNTLRKVQASQPEGSKATDESR